MIGGRATAMSIEVERGRVRNHGGDRTWRSGRITDASRSGSPQVAVGRQEDFI